MGAPVENEDIDAGVERENERGLRAVDDEARGALYRARLKEGRESVVSARTDRKDGSDRDIVRKVCRSIERVDRDAERRLGIEQFRYGQLFGHNRRDRACAQRVAHHRIGCKINILLLIAVGIDAAILSRDAGQRPVGDSSGKIDGRSCDRGNHCGNRGSVRRLRRRPIEMRTQRHALLHGRSPVARPLRGNSSAVRRWATRRPQQRNLPN